MLAALLLSFALPQAEAVPAQKTLTPGMAWFQKFEKQWSSATGIRLEVSANLTLTMQDTKMPLGTLDLDLLFAKPLHGRMDMQGKIDFMGQSQEISMSSCADGETLWMVDHEEKSAIPMGDDFSSNGEILPGFVPLLIWDGEDIQVKEVNMVQDEKTHPGLRGLHLLSEEGESTLWFDSKNNLKHCSVASGGMGEPEMEISVTSLEWLSKKQVDLQALAQSPPEDYEVMDMEVAFGGGEEEDFTKDLLPVGKAVPASTSFIRMDDTQADFASLRGKTVLVNFWFYH